MIQTVFWGHRPVDKSGSGGRRLLTISPRSRGRGTIIGDDGHGVVGRFGRGREGEIVFTWRGTTSFAW